LIFKTFDCNNHEIAFWTGPKIAAMVKPKMGPQLKSSRDSSDGKSTVAGLGTVLNWNRVMSELTKQYTQSTPYRGSSGGGGCFAAGTPVVLADGSTVPIETLQVCFMLSLRANQARTIQFEKNRKILLQRDLSEMHLVIGAGRRRHCRGQDRCDHAV
jgi:hypothetical protein